MGIGVAMRVFVAQIASSRKRIPKQNREYPVVNQDSYKKLPLIVGLPVKHGDFPVRSVSRVIPQSIWRALIPSGYVKIAIEHGPCYSGFTH